MPSLLSSVIFAGLTSEGVIGQSVLFFLVGYDTTATSIAFLIYNLTVNPEIQERLYEEIINVAGACGDKVDNA